MRRMTLYDPADLLAAIDDPEFGLGAGDLAEWLPSNARLRDIHQDKMAVVAAKSKVILKHMKQYAPDLFAVLADGKPGNRWPRKTEYTVRTKNRDGTELDEKWPSAVEALDAVREMVESDTCWDEVPEWPGYELYEDEMDNRAASLWITMMAILCNGEIEFDERHPIGRSISSISIRPVALPLVLRAVNEGKPQVQAGDIAKQLGLDQMVTFHLLEILVRDEQIQRGQRYGYAAIEPSEEDKKLAA